MGTTHHSKQSLQSHIFTSRLTYSFTLKLHQTLQTLCHPHTISTDLFATHLPKTSKCHPTSNLLSLTQASTTTHMQVAVELATISRPQRPPTAALLAALPLSLSTVSQRASPSSAAAVEELATGLLLAQRHLARTPPALQTAMAAYEVDSSAALATPSSATRTFTLDPVHLSTVQRTALGFSSSSWATPVKRAGSDSHII